MGFHFLIFGHHVETLSLNLTISYFVFYRKRPSDIRERLEDVTYLSNRILLPIAVKIYNGKSEKRQILSLRQSFKSQKTRKGNK